jgi:phenylacetate-CoA ligase
MCQYAAQADGQLTDWHLVHLGSRAAGGAGAQRRPHRRSRCRSRRCLAPMAAQGGGTSRSATLPVADNSSHAARANAETAREPGSMTGMTLNGVDGNRSHHVRARLATGSAMSLARKLFYLQNAVAMQWAPRAAIEALQLRRLRSMVAFAEAHVPLYREKFRSAGVAASDLRSVADLAHLPMLTREEVVAAYPDGILSRAPRPDDVVFRTSGTSGLFMQIAYSAEANDFLDAIYARALFATGYRPWDRMAYFWWDAAEKPRKIYERAGLMKKHFLPVDPDPEKQLARLDELRPSVIYHFPSSLLLIARILEREPHHALKPRLLICHGEFMADAQQRELERVFRCKVYNQYGAQEFNRMGWDCSRHAGLHEDADSVRIEVVKDGAVAKPGEEGELVVTGLVNRLMPLIRYRIGDLGTRIEAPCACRRGLPMFTITEGRADDVLVMPGGARIGPRTLAPRIEELPGFRQYRVIQTGPADIEVMVVKEKAAPLDLEPRIEKVILGVLGAGVRVQIRAVPEIPLSRRGKLRKIVRSREAGETSA